MAGLLIEAELVATARRWASSPCVPFPCGEEVWAYACRVAGIDAPALPEHRSRRAVIELLREQGGLVAYAGSLMTSLGWREVDAPERGDVGVAEIATLGLTCAICVGDTWKVCGPLWMAKGDRMVVTVRAPFLRAWRSPCHKR